MERLPQLEASLRIAWEGRAEKVPQQTKQEQHALPQERKRAEGETNDATQVQS